MDLQLRNKVIVVCEGEDSISGAIAKVLAAEGAIPIIIRRNEHQNSETVEAIKTNDVTCWHLTADLTKPEDCKKAIDQVLYKFGRIDGLVNDARVNNNVALEHGSCETFMASLHKNFVHYYLLAQYALPALKNSKGSILNINLKFSNKGLAGTYAYTTNNDARNALTREWAVELLKDNIRVNAVVVQNGSKISPEKFVASAEEIANTVAFLLSERSSHTTGQLIQVDGSGVHLDQAKASE